MPSKMILKIQGSNIIVQKTNLKGSNPQWLNRSPGLTTMLGLLRNNNLKNTLRSSKTSICLSLIDQVKTETGRNTTINPSRSLAWFTQRLLNWTILTLGFKKRQWLTSRRSTILFNIFTERPKNNLKEELTKMWPTMYLYAYSESSNDIKGWRLKRWVLPYQNDAQAKSNQKGRDWSSQRANCRWELRLEWQWWNCRTRTRASELRRSIIAQWRGKSGRSWR